MALTPEQLTRVPEIPLIQLPELAQRIRTSQAGPAASADYHGSVDVRGDTLATTCRKLGFQHAQATFCCPQPWATMYIDSLGRSRPCCYATLGWGLGNVKDASAQETWTGIGFRSLQLAMLRGHFPDMCSRCRVSGSMISTFSHRVHVESYIRWFHSIFTERIEPAVLERIPVRNAHDAQAVFERLRENWPELARQYLPEQQTLSPEAPRACAARRMIGRVFNRRLHTAGTQGDFCPSWMDAEHGCEGCARPYGHRAIAGRSDLTQEAAQAAMRDLEAKLNSSAQSEEDSTLYDGWLDGIVDGTISGWLYSARYPDWRVPFDILVDGEVAYSGMADAYREDLLWCGKGDGYHSFRVPTAKLAFTPSSSEIAVVVAGSRRQLRNSPQTLPR